MMDSSVHGVVDRLTDALVVEGLFLLVHADVDHPRRVSQDDLRGLALVQALHFHERHGEHHVGFTRLQHDDPGGGLRHGLEDDALDLGLALPVRVVALDHDPVAGLPLHEDVGPGPHRVEAVLVAVLLQGGRADHAPRPVSEVGQQRAEGLLHLDFQRVVVKGLGVGDEGLVEAGAQRALGGVGVPLDVEHHGLGVERRAVVEADALAQLEGPGEPVGRRFPRGGQLGDDVPLLREFHQVVVDVADHDFRGVVRLVGRVQADGLRTQGENQVLALRGQAAAGRRQGQAEGQQADQCMSTHGQFLRLEMIAIAPTGIPGMPARWRATGRHQVA